MFLHVSNNYGQSWEMYSVKSQYDASFKKRRK